MAYCADPVTKNVASAARIQATADRCFAASISSYARDRSRTTFSTSPYFSNSSKTFSKYACRFRLGSVARCASRSTPISSNSADGSGMSSDCVGCSVPRNGTTTLLNSSTPRRPSSQHRYGKAVESIVYPSVNIQITARVSRVGVAARPPRSARLLPRRRVSMAARAFSLIQTRQAALLRLTSGPSVDSPPVPLGPLPTTANAGASNPGALCLLSSSLNFARPFRVALQGRTVEGFGSKPIEGARDHFSCPEIDLDQLAHSPVFQSAGKPGWPASVSTT